MSGIRSGWLAIACAGALFGCARATPESRLRQTLGAMQQAVEARNGASLVEHVAEDFVGPEGADRTALRRTAQAAFLRHGKVGVTLGPVDVDIAPDARHATASFTAALTGGNGQPLPESLNVYQVNSGWRMVDGEWQLTSLEWTGMD